jgi:hypothetical protein
VILLVIVLAMSVHPDGGRQECQLEARCYGKATQSGNQAKPRVGAKILDIHACEAVTQITPGSHLTIEYARIDRKKVPPGQSHRFKFQMFLICTSTLRP